MRKGSKPCRLRPSAGFRACAAGRRRRRPHEAAVERAQHAGDLIVARAGRRDCRAHAACRGLASSREIELIARPSTSATTASRCQRTPGPTRPSPAACRRALRSDSGSPTTCRPCGISVYRVRAPRRRACEDPGVGVRRPRPAAASARSSAAACAWMIARVHRARDRASGAAATAVERGLELDEAAIEAGVGDRRREIADQRRAGAALGDRALGRIVGRIEIEIGQIADQAIRPARCGEAGLLARHEFERAVRAEMQNRVGAEIFPQPAVEGREGVRRREAAARTAGASDRLRSRRRAGRRQTHCQTVRRAHGSWRRRTADGPAPVPIAPRSGCSQRSRRT